MTVLTSHVMKDSSSAAGVVVADRNEKAPDASGIFDFRHLVDCANAKGAENDEQRAEKAGISLSTYYRLQRGDANLKISTVGEIATSLGTTAARLMGGPA